MSSTPRNRLDGAHEDRAAVPFLARDRVEAPVHAVDEVHVRDARRAVEVPGALRQPRDGVARRIVGTEVGLGLDDPAGRDPIGRRVLEDRTEQVAGDQLGGTIVKR